MKLLETQPFLKMAQHIQTLTAILICGLNYDFAERTDCLTSDPKKVKRVQMVLSEEKG